jgi:hypothetical protein
MDPLSAFASALTVTYFIGDISQFIHRFGHYKNDLEKLCKRLTELCMVSLIRVARSAICKLTGIVVPCCQSRA